MKVKQLGEIIQVARDMYRSGGNAGAAQALDELSALFAGHETMTVSKFVVKIENAAKNQSSRT